MSYWRAYSRLACIVTAVCVAVGLLLERRFDLGEPYVLPIIIAVVGIALFVGHYLPEMTLTLLMKLRSFRRHLFGRTWVEGYWVTLTAFADGSTRPGIVHMEYARDNYSKLDIVGWQKGEDVISSHSTYATIDDDLHLVNYFSTTEARPRLGVAVGKLFCADNSYPNEYHGKRFYFSDEKTSEVYQRAIKLSSKQVRDWKSRLGERWISAILFDASESLATYFAPIKGKQALEAAK
jgi:hypothetical protein